MLLSNGWQKFVVENAAVQWWAKICSVKKLWLQRSHENVPLQQKFDKYRACPKCTYIVEVSVL